MPELPPELQRKILEKWVVKVFRDLNLDPVFGLEALDVTFDAALSYNENKGLLEEELGSRGVFAEAPKPETAEWEKLEELPEFKPDVELRRELEEMKSEREQYRREAERLKEKLQRREQLSEAEQLRLAEEMRGLEKKLQMMLSGIPDTYIKELKEIFLKLPGGADEDKFWKWFALHRDEIKEKHGAVVATSFEGSMKEFLVGKPPLEKALPPPAEVALFKPPEGRFKVGDRVFHEGFREVAVRQTLWDKDHRRWIYIVERKSGRLERVPEVELIELPPIPAGVVVPGAPAPPRAPRAPPPPLEFICPKCGLPLTPIKEISWVEQVPVMEEPEWGLPKVPTGKYETIVSKIMVPPAELVFICLAGRGEEFLALIGELELAVKFKNVKDTQYFANKLQELEREMRAKCPFAGMYFKVRHGKMVGPEAQRDVIRQLMAPVAAAPPAPRARREPTPLELHYEAIRGVEGDPAFRKYVEEEVGLKWDAYLRSDGWSKDALRRAFGEKLSKGLSKGL